MACCRSRLDHRALDPDARGVKDFYSAQAQPFPALVADRDIHVLGAVSPLQSLVVLAVAVAVAGGLHVFLSTPAPGA